VGGFKDVLGGCFVCWVCGRVFLLLEGGCVCGVVLLVGEGLCLSEKGCDVVWFLLFCFWLGVLEY